MAEEFHSIKPLVLVPPGVLDKKALREMRRAGYLVLEVADVSALKVVTPPPMVPLDALGAFALEVLADEKIMNFDIRDTFRRRVLKAAMAAAKPAEAPAV